MPKLLKTLILSAAVAAMTIAPLAQAQADHRWRHKRHHVVHHHDNSGVIAAGIVGLAVGAIIAGSVASRRHVAPAPVPIGPAPGPRYYPPAPVAVDDEPKVIYADDIGGYAPAEPWTREWYRYCEALFRSFDPDSGTYLGYDGRRHFCVAR